MGGQISMLYYINRANQISIEQFPTVSHHPFILQWFSGRSIRFSCFDFCFEMADHLTADLLIRNGLVLDPWRYGGTLYYAKADADDRYEWVPREVVFAQKRAWEAQKQRLATN